MTRGYKVECGQAAIIVLFFTVCPLYLDCGGNNKHVIVKPKERPQELMYITRTSTASTAMLIAS
jgi:hypothetical protein